MEEPPDFVRMKNLADDHEINEHYLQGEELGEGMFGRTVEVTDVRDPTKRFAMKVQPKVSWFVEENNPTRLFAEIVIANRVLPKHPNIIELVDILIAPTEVYTVLELCEGGTMGGFFPKANDVTAPRAFGQLVEAVHTCHAYGVTHCDIKDDNILFKDRERTQLKLIDFGCSVYRPDWAVKIHNQFDPTKWFNPEDLIPRNTITKVLDIKALGRMLHSILVGKYVPPTFSGLIVQTELNIRTEMFGPAALDLLMKIGPDPFGPKQNHEYWTTDQIRQHPWITGVTFIPLQLSKPVRTLHEEFQLLQKDLTVLVRLLKEWMIMPLTIVKDEADLAQHYQILGTIERGNVLTRVLKVRDVYYQEKSRIMKVIYGRIDGKPPYVNGDSETIHPIFVYMELLITLRILPPHDNIVAVRQIFVNKEYVAVVKDLLWTNSSLEDFFVNANDSTCRPIFRQLAKTVRFLHRHGVVHNGLHPHHILFTDNKFSHCKIINFTKALYVTELAELRHENFQPEKYINPQLAEAIKANADEQVDITALGRILHAMMTRIWQPDASTCGELWPLQGEFHPDAHDLLSKIGPEPHGPPESDREIKILEICQHPWVRSYEPRISLGIPNQVRHGLGFKGKPENQTTSIPLEAKTFGKY